MKNLRWMLALAAVAAITVGCSEEATTTTTTTDTATAKDTAGDTATTGDTTTTGDTVAADVASDATTTAAAKGCTADGDKTFLGALADATKLKEFKATLSSCTLTKGCLGKANATAKITCIADCMDAAYTSAGLTKACSACYGLTGWCAAGPCLASCIDSASAACGECVAKNCDPYTNACKAGTCDPYDASNCGATK
jgi:hypothetical protein